MTGRLRAIGAFWYGFLIGEDWQIAAEVTAAVAITAVLAHTIGAAWLLLPLAVAVILAASIRRATRPRPPAPTR